MRGNLVEGVTKTHDKKRLSKWKSTLEEKVLANNTGRYESWDIQWEYGGVSLVIFAYL